jgi:hypothetical protein
MRHNPAMRCAAPALPRCTTCLRIALSCACLAGCHERNAPPPASASTQAHQARAEWQGRQPCADCDAIDTQLVLERGGDRDRYRLVETFRSGNAGARFVEQGRWGREARLLHLRGDAGSVRFYALLPDGRLQPRGMHGAALEVVDQDALVPVSAEYTP